VKVSTTIHAQEKGMINFTNLSLNCYLNPLATRMFYNVLKATIHVIKGSFCLLRNVCYRSCFVYYWILLFLL